VLITVHPEHLATPVLQMMTTIIVTGETPTTALRIFADAHGSGEKIDEISLGTGEAVVWDLARQGSPTKFKAIPTQSERRRHQRKYALGQLGEDKSFYFRGPRSRLNLRAHNLVIFVQIADGVDDETWLYHLRRNDYSAWLRDAIKDHELATEVLAIERDGLCSAAQTRRQIRDAILRRYTHSA
jgi:hypothetical protein